MAMLRTVPRLTRPVTSQFTLLRRNNGARSFSIASITSSDSLSAADLVALLPASAMEAMHSVGLPWYAVLPLSAVLFRSLVVYPFFQRPARIKLVRRMNIQPLVDAKLSSERRSMLRIKSNMLPTEKMQLTLQHYMRVKKLEYELFRQGYRFERFFSFLTLIAVSDGLRRLCGAKAGLLQTLLGPFDLIASSPPKDQDSPAAAPAHSIDTSSASAAPPVYPTQSGGVETEHLISSAVPVEQGSEIVTSVATPIESLWFDPSLLDGGFSWCADLTAADPTFILPILFSTSFFASIYFSPRVDRPGSEGPPLATNMQRIGMTVAVLSFIPALQMPSALLLYFITNMGVGQLQARWLAYTMPLSPVPTACSRPIRLKHLKEIKI